MTWRSRYLSPGISSTFPAGSRGSREGGLRVRTASRTSRQVHRRESFRVEHRQDLDDPAIVADLAQAGYVIKQKDGRRNRYQIEARLPLPEPGTREPAISEVLVLLLGDTGGHDGPPGLAAAGRPTGVDGADVITTRIDGHCVPGGLDGDGRTALGTAGDQAPL
jgi:hypothetical protein